MASLVSARGLRAFTLLELLVVAAVIATLLGLLFPALGGARVAAHRVACASMQRQLALQLLQYTSSNNGWIPGYNTSGRELWDSSPDPAVIRAINRNSLAPVQVNDWISPCGGADAPENRQHRFYRLLETFADPAQELRSPVWIGSGRGGPEIADWIEENELPAPRGVSYLMPTLFQLYGGPRNPVFITLDSSPKFRELRKQFDLPPNYRPRLDLVGDPSRKVAFADGFRYVSATQLDTDFSYHASYNWGAFTDRSPCALESTPWGSRGGNGSGLGPDISYRHRGKMNAAFWDGHVEALDRHASRNPALWAPRNSIFIGRRTFTEPESYDHGFLPADEDPTRSQIH